MGHLGVNWEKLERFLCRVQARFPLKHAILFGSRARGEELRSSDYDLLLVSPAFAGLPYPERIGAVLALWDLDVGLEPICLTPEEFQERAEKITVVAEARREGQELWPPKSSQCPNESAHST